MRRAAMLLVIVGLGLAVLSSGGVFYLLQQTTSLFHQHRRPCRWSRSWLPRKTSLSVPPSPRHGHAEGLAAEARAAKGDYDPKQTIGAMTSSPIVAGEVDCAVEDQRRS